MRSLPSEAGSGRKGASDQSRAASPSLVRFVRDDVHLAAAQSALLLGCLQAAQLATRAQSQRRKQPMTVLDAAQRLQVRMAVDQAARRRIQAERRCASCDGLFRSTWTPAGMPQAARPARAQPGR
jgi:hypothetical protein